jgi:hypothetical protein
MGWLEVAHYRFDVVGLLRDETLTGVDPSAVAEQPSTVGYWMHAGHDRVRLLDLDPVSKVALTLVDGQRTKDSIERALTVLGLSDARERLDGLLGRAQGLGLVDRCCRADHGRLAACASS